MSKQKRAKPTMKTDKKSWQKRTAARDYARRLKAAMDEAAANGATLEIFQGKPVAVTPIATS